MRLAGEAAELTDLYRGAVDASGTFKQHSLAYVHTGQYFDLLSNRRPTLTHRSRAILSESTTNTLVSSPRSTMTEAGTSIVWVIPLSNCNRPNIPLLSPGVIGKSTFTMNVWVCGSPAGRI